MKKNPILCAMFFSLAVLTCFQSNRALASNERSNIDVVCDQVIDQNVGGKAAHSLEAWSLNLKRDGDGRYNVKDPLAWRGAGTLKLDVPYNDVSMADISGWDLMLQVTCNPYSTDRCIEDENNIKMSSESGSYGTESKTYVNYDKSTQQLNIIYREKGGWFPLFFHTILDFKMQCH